MCKGQGNERQNTRLAVKFRNGELKEYNIGPFCRVVIQLCKEVLDDNSPPALFSFCAPHYALYEHCTRTEEHRKGGKEVRTKEKVRRNGGPEFP